MKDQVEKILTDPDFVKLTLSKARIKSSTLKNVYADIKVGEKGNYLHFTYRYKTKDQTFNYSKGEALPILIKHLEEDFFFASFFTSGVEWTLKQSKKGKVTWTKRAHQSKVNSTGHDKNKRRLVPESAPFLQGLGLASTNGLVYKPAQKKYAQINRYVELISHLLADDLKDISIADMGSGKGYLTFALYDYLTRKAVNANVLGVELRPDLVEKCNSIAQKHHYEGLKFVKGNIQETKVGRRDMIIALHACDIATDMAILKALESEAKYIVLAPCCHKQVRKSMQVPSSLSPMLKHGILLERQAEMLTDTIRALILQSKGYKTQIFEFISSEHTGKNVMITAVKTNRPRLEAIEEVNYLKQTFGIDHHYLERLVDEY